MGCRRLACFIFDPLIDWLQAIFVSMVNVRLHCLQVSNETLFLRLFTQDAEESINLISEILCNLRVCRNSLDCCKLIVDLSNSLITSSRLQLQNFVIDSRNNFICLDHQLPRRIVIIDWREGITLFLWHISQVCLVSICQCYNTFEDAELRTIDEVTNLISNVEFVVQSILYLLAILV